MKSLEINLKVTRSMIKEVFYKYGANNCQITGIDKEGLYPIKVTLKLN